MLSDVCDPITDFLGLPRKRASHLQYKYIVIQLPLTVKSLKARLMVVTQ